MVGEGVEGGGGTARGARNARGPARPDRPHTTAHRLPPPPHIYPALKPDDRVAAVADLLMRRGVLRRCERVYHKPRPGMDRVAKWPKHMYMSQQQARGWCGRVRGEGGGGGCGRRGTARRHEGLGSA